MKQLMHSSNLLLLLFFLQSCLEIPPKQKKYEGWQTVYETSVDGQSDGDKETLIRAATSYLPIKARLSYRSGIKVYNQTVDVDDITIISNEDILILTRPFILLDNKLEELDSNSRHQLFFNSQNNTIVQLKVENETLKEEMRRAINVEWLVKFPFEKEVFGRE